MVKDVLEVLYIDGQPEYSVEKPGFKQMVKHFVLDIRYLVTIILAVQPYVHT